MKNINTCIVLVILCMCHFGFAQITSNGFVLRNSLLSKNDLQNSYKYNLSDHLFDFNHDSLVTGMDGNTIYRTSAVSHYENYNDNFTYQLAPFLYYKDKSHVTFDIRAVVENIKDDYVYPQRTYWGDTFLKHRGSLDIAKITYNSGPFKIKFGRDYYMPGVYFYENLLFSKYNYSYDQLSFEYSNKYISISSTYLSLNTSTDTLTYDRNINTHRFTVNLGDGYLAFNDLMLYGGYKRYPDIMAFNPFVLLYPYRKNKKNLDGNNIMTLEFYYRLDDYFIFTELLLDDWQADKKVPADLEPSEWGMNTTLGVFNILRNMDWKINYTRVANRTYNVSTYSYEKYIHKNYPIGHFLGNNFWEAKSTLTYTFAKDNIVDVTFYYLESGDEALYGTFNTDYLNYSVKQGYDESFPFGSIKKQAGFVLNSFYAFTNNFLINAKLGYWFTNTRLKHNTNFSINLAYRFMMVKN